MKGFLKIAGLLGLLGGLVLLEHRRPLRVEKESKPRRNARNLAVATLGTLTIHFAESPVLYPLSTKVQQRRWGLLKRVRLPRMLETIAAVLLLDYAHYIQHVLHHRVPLLWRFHAVHYVDLDLDVFTALRFHFGEIALSIPYRVAQVLLIGVDPQSLTTWQTLTLLSILFHQLKSQAAKIAGRSLRALRCHTTLARHPSLERSHATKLQLVRWIDCLGCAARDAQLGSSAARHRDRCTGF
jgi:sterol desaturase/sphingolipid hydroxylase (fatty acid hydroxylase superfamily)